jgi:hypothetical protein
LSLLTRAGRLYHTSQASGKFVTAYENAKKKIGVDNQAYHSGAITGRQVWLMLKKRVELLQLVLKAADSEEEKKNAATAFASVLRRWTMAYELFGLMKAARMLEPGEIDHLSDLCSRYAQEFRLESQKPWRLAARKKKIAKQLHVPLKLHFLQIHVPQFARRWGSVGLFSEDAAESIHALWNRLNRRYACIRSEIERAKSVLSALAVIQDPATIAASEKLAKRRKRKVTIKTT